MLKMTQVNQIQGDVTTQLHKDWVKTLLMTIPFGVLAFVLGMFFEGPSGQGTPFDTITFPFLAISMIAFGVWIMLKPQHLRLVISLICFGLSVFLISKTVYLLFFLPEFANPLYQLTEGFSWTAVIYLLAFLVPGIRTGKIIAVIFTISTLLLSVFYAFVATGSEYYWNLLYALTEQNLANAVSLCLTFAFIRLKERYTISKNQELLASELARYDQLTQLPNRLLLQEKLDLIFTNKEQEPFALLFIDIDGFKNINDSLGHQAGDQLLKDIALRLTKCLRSGDIAARISGDEFVFIAKEINKQSKAESIAQRLLNHFAEPFLLLGKPINITSSIGIALYPLDGKELNDLLKNADIAMYQAKQAGKNAYISYQASMSGKLEQKRALANDLRDALSKQELELYFQPIFDLETSETLKCEALLRWKHPKRGFVSPAEFIPLAEENGLIVPIGQWVLENACAAAKAWQPYLPDVAVAVNISALQFATKGFTQGVIQTIQSSGLLPAYLELEITESVVLNSIDETTTCLNELRAFGIRISLDDFGTGYSSLLYLQNLPVDTLKIDRSFVNKLEKSPEEANFAIALIEAIVGLSAHLNLSVVAEGIETKEQLECLRNVGCHLGQGYYFSRPVDQEQLLALLSVTDLEVASELSVVHSAVLN